MRRVAQLLVTIPRLSRKAAAERAAAELGLRRDATSRVQKARAKVDALIAAERARLAAVGCAADGFIKRFFARAETRATLDAAIVRACQCGEPNPSPLSRVACIDPACHALSPAGAFMCIDCGSPVAPPALWTVCPRCGASTE